MTTKDIKDGVIFTTQPSPTDFDNDSTAAGGERFYTPALDITISANKVLLHGGQDTTSFDADAWCEYPVPLSWATNTFLWQGDAIDVNDSNELDLQFCVNSSCTSNGGEDITVGEGSRRTTEYTSSIADAYLKTINPKNIIPTQSRVYYNAMSFYGNSAVSTQSNLLKVGPDFLRYLGFKLFGISTTDLFKDEYKHNVDLDKLSFKEFSKQMISLTNYRYIHATGENPDYVRWNDISTGTAAVDNLYNNFPTKAIIKQMIDNVRSRFSNLTDLILPYDHITGQTFTVGPDNNIYNALTGARITDSTIIWYKTPFKVGDMLFFKITVTPHDEQDNVLGAAESNPKFADRTYRVRLNIVADDDGKVTGTSNVTGSNGDHDSFTYHPWSASGWNGTTSYYQNTPTPVVGDTTAP